MFKFFGSIFIDFLIRKGIVKPRRKIDFAFIVHPRDKKDIVLNFPFLKLLPAPILLKLTALLPPITVGTVRTAFQSPDLHNVKGIIVTIPLIAQDIINHQERAKKKIHAALRLAERKGALIAGLGALTSPVMGGGSEISEDLDIGITNGNTIAAISAIDAVENIIKNQGKKFEDLSIAILGASGSVGGGITSIIAKKKVQKIYAIGRTAEHLQEIKHNIQSSAQNSVPIETSTDLYKLKEADLIIVATNAPGAILKKTYLSPPVLIFDITQPFNVDSRLVRKNKTISLYRGSSLKAPRVNISLDLGLPPGVIFSCLGETIILAAEQAQGRYFTGPVTMDKINALKPLLKKYNFHPSSYYVNN